MNNNRKKSVSHLVSFLCLSVYLFTGCAINENIHESKTSTGYSFYVSHFSKVDIEQIKDMLEENREFVLYVGKESCSYCQIFAPKLYEASIEIEDPIFYWDVENIDDEAKEISDFLNEYHIEYTPMLLRFFGRKRYEDFSFDSEKVSVNDLKEYLN